MQTGASTIAALTRLISASLELTFSDIKDGNIDISNELPRGTALTDVYYSPVYVMASITKS